MICVSWVFAGDTYKHFFLLLFFSEGLYDYVTTMVCVVVNGEPTIGVIHKPFSGETGMVSLYSEFFVQFNLYYYGKAQGQNKTDVQKLI